MFKDVSQQHDHNMVTISVNDTVLQVPDSYSVAAALLANGYRTNRRSGVSGEQRGSYCLMGVCFECLVEINGQPNQQGCMTQVIDGMSIRFQPHCGEEPLTQSVEQEQSRCK
ncbi:(2Fe-2S)-binding protein [Vibrio sp. B1FLJ16]|uniref:(2Fe-2S)-binding protein n=1 Tax=Vibrio sp. B1FLJ16 TaxID=2751178 RepID=UPI0015F45334|nr:(2Fe-2S)-binding protein [Vibrio sp. B1FLJ16]CAD7820839.1 NAD(FAD)-dependent dehydrogenase [Vibrio sp. B1FLJ16]CAE6944525.1 NAD(FAD)-dependent dehydrogenase [Vibrio sp. B1FLJ16]